VLHARDTDGLSAVQAYEARYGMVPEKPIHDWSFPHEDIGEHEFEQIWSQARSAVESVP
jgi:hypothetical protein